MKKQQANYKKLSISALFTLLIWGASMLYFDILTLALSIKQLGLPLMRLMGLITIGLFTGQVIEAMGWTRQLAVLARPLFRYSKMGNHCSAAFTMAFISGVPANAMLLEFYETKKISKLQLFLANYINQFPAFFLHLPTTMFIVLPLTGVAGGIYFFITFLATLFRTLCFLSFGHFFLNSRDTVYSSGQTEDICSKQEKSTPKKIDRSTLIRSIQTRLPIRITNIFTWVLPIYTLVFILQINGFFEQLNQTISSHLTLSLIPVESLSIVILSFVAEFTSGFAAAGALMNAGVLSVKQTVIALLLGNVLAFPIRALRHQLPQYMGIFSPKMGLELLLSGQFFRILSIVIIGTLYYWAV
ncbi:MAG: nucleoside recognition protein [Proteobacteria bacterium]|nr:nucleoside recognition protein [Desulfobacula sp.]MBU3951063.1 nucleoside recognition protein [Pseudomonadota bacterium]MBU4133547.1 nucleoside recognition protein [Pseudomonadota bacterium]